jgi:hypothetical protein
MYTWNQYKSLNENRSLNENVVLKKYQIYLGKLELEEFLRNPIDGGDVQPTPTIPTEAFFLLQENGDYILQENNDKIRLA